MPTYEVTCTGTVTETYEVEAASEAEALANWTEGKLVHSEASTFPDSAKPQED